MSNPLTDYQGLPPYQQIKPEHVQPAIENVLAHNRARLKEILTDQENYSWAILISPEQLAVLSQFRAVFAQLGQAGVVSFAKGFVVHHRVQMTYRRPGLIEFVLNVFQRGYQCDPAIIFLAG